MSQIKVRGKMQRIAVINQNRVVAKAVRYSTVKQDELTSYAAPSATDESEFTANFSQNLRNVIIRFLPDTELKQMIANTGISTSVDTEDYTAQGADFTLPSRSPGAARTSSPLRSLSLLLS